MITELVRRIILVPLRRAGRSRRLLSVEPVGSAVKNFSPPKFRPTGRVGLLSWC